MRSDEMPNASVRLHAQRHYFSAQEHRPIGAVELFDHLAENAGPIAMTVGRPELAIDRTRSASDALAWWSVLLRPPRPGWSVLLLGDQRSLRSDRRSRADLPIRGHPPMIACGHRGPMVAGQPWALAAAMR